jgi:hypothetical protein
MNHDPARCPSSTTGGGELGIHEESSNEGTKVQQACECRSMPKFWTKALPAVVQLAVPKVEGKGWGIIAGARFRVAGCYYHSYNHALLKAKTPLASSFGHRPSLPPALPPHVNLYTMYVESG